MRAMLLGLVVVNVPVVHCVVEELASVKPLGMVSVMATPVNAVAVLGLVIVNVNGVVLVVVIVVEPKALATTGGATTVSEEVP